MSLISNVLACTLICCLTFACDGKKDNPNSPKETGEKLSATQPDKSAAAVLSTPPACTAGDQLRVKEGAKAFKPENPTERASGELEGGEDVTVIPAAGSIPESLCLVAVHTINPNAERPIVAVARTDLQTEAQFEVDHASDKERMWSGPIDEFPGQMRALLAKFGPGLGINPAEHEDELEFIDNFARRCASISRSAYEGSKNKYGMAMLKFISPDLDKCQYFIIDVAKDELHKSDDPSYRGLYIQASVLGLESGNYGFQLEVLVKGQKEDKPIYLSNIFHHYGIIVAQFPLIQGTPEEAEAVRMGVKLAEERESAAAKATQNRPPGAPGKTVDTTPDANVDAVPPPPPPPEFGLLDADAIAKLDEAKRMDLFRFKADPTLFDNPDFLKYFVALNACAETPQAIGDLNNEFKRPRILAYYKENGGKILSLVPSSIKLDINNSYLVGEYDSENHAFHFVDFHKHPEPINISRITAANDAHRQLYCNAGGYSAQYWFAPEGDYALRFPPVRIADLPMAENKAEAWVETLQGQPRYVHLSVEFDLAETPPTKGNPLLFGATIRRVTATGGGNAELGVLYQAP